MPTAKKNDLVTEKEYLDGEQLSDVRHEYINGKVYAMVGATRDHNLISGNIHNEIKNHLKGKPCQPFMSDMKVKVDNKFFYPDVLVDCSEDADGKSFFTENPVLIIEVLSPSTMTTDRTVKFTAYTQIQSLQEYVLIDQNSINVEIFRRNDNWHGQVYLNGSQVQFKSIDLTLPIKEIYTGLKLGSENLEDSENLE